LLGAADGLLIRAAASTQSLGGASEGLMRQAFLFYSFMAIFVVTAIVTLLGATGAVTIRETQLNMLLGAFLVELAGAVVALYRRTDFFKQPSDNLATSLGTTIEAFDQISDEIEAVIKNQPTDPNHAHRFLIRKMGDLVVAYEKMRVITAAELEQLPKDQRDLIRTYERSMDNFTKEWRKLKTRGTSQLDPKVRGQMLDLLRGAKDDLVGVLDSLQNRGIYLDDHYIEVRDLVAKL
jgi:hypothetical protein